MTAAMGLRRAVNSRTRPKAFDSFKELVHLLIETLDNRYGSADKLDFLHVAPQQMLDRTANGARFCCVRSDVDGFFPIANWNECYYRTYSPGRFSRVRWRPRERERDQID